MKRCLLPPPPPHVTGHAAGHTLKLKYNYIHDELNQAVLGSLNRLTPRDAYLRKRCVYLYQRILPDPLKEYTNLKLFMFIASVYVAEIYFPLPKIPLLPRLA